MGFGIGLTNRLSHIGIYSKWIIRSSIYDVLTRICLVISRRTYKWIFRRTKLLTVIEVAAVVLLLYLNANDHFQDHLYQTYTCFRVYIMNSHSHVASGCVSVCDNNIIVGTTA